MTKSEPDPPSGSCIRPAKRTRRRILFATLAGLAMLPVGITAVLRWLPPPTTPFMMITAHGNKAPIVRTWISLEHISPYLQLAVIAAEDTKFCSHNGFDWDAIEQAQSRNQQGRRLRGASTISMQTAKNVFLWPARSWLRKGLEAGFTLLIETLWPKRRILEIYLNVVEWGPGIYGAEAAAQHYFARPAANLTMHQAALLAAALPSPSKSNPARPSTYLETQAKVVERRMAAQSCL